MPKRKNPRELDLTNEEIERFVFPKKVRDAIHQIVDTDKDEPPSQEPAGQDVPESPCT